MGLKVRRLKNGFAYYGEYKFADGNGGQHCIYEQVQAASLRDARRQYAARRKELQKQLPKRSPAPRSRNDRGGHDDGARVVAALLRDLQARDYISDGDLREALASAYTDIYGMAAGTAARRAKEFLRGAVDGGGQRLLISTDDSGSIVPFGKTHHGGKTEVGAEFAGELGNARPYRVRLLPS